MRGARFGRLTVLRRYERDYVSPSGARLAMWLCRCDCGCEIVARGDMLRRGNVKSCGCLRSEKARVNIQKALEGYKKSRAARKEKEGCS